jgi:hypothetical protein
MRLATLLGILMVTVLACGSASAHAGSVQCQHGAPGYDSVFCGLPQSCLTGSMHPGDPLTAGVVGDTVNLRMGHPRSLQTACRYAGTRTIQLRLIVTPHGQTEPVQVKRYPAITSSGSPTFTTTETVESVCAVAPQGGQVALEETNAWKPKTRGVIPKGKGYAHAGRTFSTKVHGKLTATWNSGSDAIFTCGA